MSPLIPALLTITENQAAYGQQVADGLKQRGFRVLADLRNENLYRNGHALSNIQQRLKLLYSGRASMKFTEENKGVRVLVELPQ